nr:MAG TPA: tail protein [Caudoviricetes sp.]
MPSVSMDSYRVPFQVGTTLSGVTVGTRKPTVTGYITAGLESEEVLGMTWKEYFEKQEEAIQENKMKLDKLISVYQDVLITVGDYFLNARPTQPPKYSTDMKENNEVICYFSLEFECYNPLFYKGSKLISLAMISGGFHFPLIIPSEKVIFGEIFRWQSISIENNGDADVGCIIRIKANGGVVKNPKIYNVNTNEFLEFDGVTLDNGDYITITTDIGEENAVKHDISTTTDISVIGNLKPKSKFFQIKQGSNFYAYYVEEEYINNVEISIEYTERYFNVRGM